MWHRATIVSRRQLSPSVTGVTLQIHQPNNVSFLPGQWVDFRPLPSASWKPNDGSGKTIGGYSITSIPQTLPQLSLAIQSSRHPVAKWVTLHARLNDLVDVQVGGTFTFKSPQAAPLNRILFIAGGVGINPLFSMIQQWKHDFCLKNPSRNSRAFLLYSGRTIDDLLFVDELVNMVGDTPNNFRVVLSTTQQSTHDSNSLLEAFETTNNVKNVALRDGRIDMNMLSEAVTWLNSSNDNDTNGHKQSEAKDGNMIADSVYVCGPPGMPESMLNILSPDVDKKESAHVLSTKDVHFEKWW